MDISIISTDLKSYLSYLEFSTFLSFIIVGILIICGVALISKISEERKTRTYRKDLTNLYVAGKIKKIAKTEDIDLDSELKSFRKFEKTMNTAYKELDDVLENEMKEKIREDFEKAKSKETSKEKK